ncbi:hypothetical protein STEG23_033630, partial [Scotinomys teguina]
VSPFFVQALIQAHSICVAASNMGPSASVTTFECTEAVRGLHEVPLPQMTPLLFCLCVRLCTTWMPGAHRGQNGALDPLKLELHPAVSSHG